MPLKRTITHWTAGGNRANDLDRQHYHFIVEHDGKVVKGTEEPEDNIVTGDGDYAAHVLNLNTGSIGVAMAGMRGAVESPFDAGPSPLTEKQFEAHCLMLAELHRQYSIPITRTTCLTHAEVEPTLGVKQKGKWDITRLPFKPEIRGAIPVGDYMRERVLSYFGAAGGVLPKPRPELLAQGSAGEEVKRLQEELSALGYVSFPDGKYGPNTVSAVKKFQRANGLEEDGVAGPQTIEKLRSGDAVRYGRESNEDILRERGSKTIAAADAQTVIGIGTTAVAGAGAVLDTARQASSVAEGAWELLTTKWWVFILLLGLFAIWRLTERIKAARVEAARSGENLSK